MADRRICPRDGFLKVKIGGRWQCVAEYLDGCIGVERVVDLVKRGETVYYVFESGHELPMLCFCCGEPLDLDLEASRRDIVGRRLESMAVEPVELEDEREVRQFRLELSKKGLLSRRLAVPVSADVAARMVHPPTCGRGARACALGRPPGERRRKKGKR